MQSVTRGLWRFIIESLLSLLEPQEAVPILNIAAPHSAHLPRVAGRPFFIVICSVSCISRLSLHFRQYPVIVSSFHSLYCLWLSSMIETSCPVHESGLYARIGPCSCISCFLRWWRRLDIVLAVQPEPLDDLDRVLLMLVRVGVRGLKERR